MRNLVIILYLFIFSANIFAETEKSCIIINGNSVDKIVTEISYDADNIVLKWSDDTSSSDRMAKTLSKLAADNDINNTRISSISGLFKDNILIDGIVPGNSLEIYDINGFMKMRNETSSSSTTMNISNLNTGIYLLRTGNDIIKFVKL